MKTFALSEDEKNFTKRILATITAYKNCIIKSKSKMSAFDIQVESKVKEIISSTSDFIAMINSIIDYLNNAWDWQDRLYSLVCANSLRDDLLLTMAEVTRDNRMAILEVNHNNLLAEHNRMVAEKAANEQELVTKHAAEVRELKASAALDKKHLEKSIASLSSTIQSEVEALKVMMAGKNDEVEKLRAENARLLDLTYRLQNQLHSSLGAENRV